MSFIWLAWTVYAIILVLVCLRILYETHSTNKTIAYLLFCFFIPVIGICFYFAFGINFWKTKLYAGKLKADKELLDQMTTLLKSRNPSATISTDKEMAAMLVKSLKSPVTGGNRVKLLLNGEGKFPELLAALEQATHHIHMEYYIYEQDEIGTAIIELLIRKARKGVAVRFIYDDFGSPSIKRKTEKRMSDAGIEVFPFSKIHFYLLANRINYRNHRKIVIIDGCTGFVGGINVSDRYINNKKGQLYWRDTHLRIDGPGMFYLQYLFMADWNFCCDKKLSPADDYFKEGSKVLGNSYVQVASSGPDAAQPAVLLSLLQAIYLAKSEILITTPYFIPGDGIIDALRAAALSGLSVKLLVPGKCDSKIVNAASKANYNDLLQAGVEIYIYQKGFVHAKTMVTDTGMSIIGTANMDHRSFELNFEVNAIVYDADLSAKLRAAFFNDLANAEKLDREEWQKRSFLHQLPEKIARLGSPSL